LKGKSTRNKLECVINTTEDLPKRAQFPHLQNLEDVSQEAFGPNCPCKLKLCAKSSVNSTFKNNSEITGVAPAENNNLKKSRTCRLQNIIANNTQRT